ncbi:MAG: histidine kinase [Clostridiales bacterium]|nr:histidine kinase [Clostridiales bacterium]
MFTAKSLHVSFEIWGCIVCLIAAVCISFSSLEKKKRNLLLSMQLVTATLLVMDAFAWGYRGYPGVVGYYMVRISNFLVFLLSDVILLLFHAYVCSYLFDKKDLGKMPRRVLLGYGVSCLGMFLVIVSQFIDLYYYFDADNIYHRNMMHPLSMIIGIVCMAIDCSLLIQYRKRMKKPLFISMISYIVLPAVATVVLIFFYGISLVNIAISISVIFMFIMAMVEQSKMLRDRERELYDLKIDVLLSQIKPHFIYNALTAIKYLCKTDPKAAEETLDEFAAYLRGNIDSLTLRESISFRQELKHVKNYLAIEKKRFGEKLNVIYDIRSEDFRVPALSLQPIVENAVKHGITKRMEGGTIRISTCKEQGFHIIKVEDDGIGFDCGKMMEQDVKKQVGIRNARSRLENMCGGRLNIFSVLGKGTVVEIQIPVKEKVKQ